MSINHHPSEDTLLRHAAGTLEGGPRVVVAVHLEGCAECRARVGRFEAVGGDILSTIDPVSMSEDALDHLLARIEVEREGRGDASAPIVLPRASLGIELPAALAGCGVGPWRWLGPGVRWSRVTVPEDPAANVMLLKVAARKRLPEHSHSGREYTQVLTGSFSDARGRYLRGDMDEADAEVEHLPVVDDGSECICVAAIDGHMRLRGFFGRLIQPLIGD